MNAIQERLTSVYLPLHVRSNFSFLEGASHPEELVDRAADLGMDTLALTDRDSLSGVVRAFARGRERGVRIIPGSALSVELPSGEEDSLLLLASTREGYARLTRLLTLGHSRRPKGESSVPWSALLEQTRGLIAISSNPSLFSPLYEAFGDDLFAGLERHLRPHDRRVEEAIVREASRLGVLPVAANRVLFHDRSRRPLANLLVAIRHRKPVRECGFLLHPNGEFDLKSEEAMRARFEDRPEALEATLEIKRRTHFELSHLRYRYPEEHLPEGENESSHLRSLTFQGAKERYPRGIPPKVRAQLEAELALIAELGYGGYFLTIHDLVRFCEREGILCQGRGSAANSAVCFCLGITALDPSKMDLLFERFLSRERREPPDIDLDIEHNRREEVIQYVYARFGRRRAAMVANLVRYRIKSAIRDLGKALELPEEALERAAALHHGGSALDPAKLVEAGLDPDEPRVRAMGRAVQEILGFPRHLSIHPGGFLLGHEPVDEIVPIEPARLEGRTVIQWDKDDIETLGLFKVDLLGLGMLHQIHLAFDLIRAHEGKELSFLSIPPDDPETYAMLRRADAIGVFQLESRAQMMMLPRMRPREFYDLVIQIALIRPGPIQGGMVHPYLRRRHGKEPVVYAHPRLKKILKRTLGVPIFQEQVMKLAIEVADYTPGEADQLRRDMAAFRRDGRIEAHRERLLSRMVKNGIASEFAEQIFAQIRGFGEYGFPESHSASFAILAYISAYLKRHHHEAFSCALLNAWPMGFYHPSTLIDDAKRHGIPILPIDINESEWDSTLERTLDGKLGIRIGFRFVKGLRKWSHHGRPYRSIADFMEKVRLDRGSLLALAEAGAFDSLGKNRREALWEIRGMMNIPRGGLPLRPKSESRFRPHARGETILLDHDRLGLSPVGHPMETIRPLLDRRKIPKADELIHFPEGATIDYVGLVICRQRPRTKTGVFFMTLEDESGLLNLIIPKELFDAKEEIARAEPLVEVSGRLERTGEMAQLIVERLERPRLDVSSAKKRSRDFH
ncbi:MAG: error-prone DNA polymerase [Sandaracinaceae bacterium]|nr:error-prone DNA polymerase [Sandaracinaceae bacterium]